MGGAGGIAAMDGRMYGVGITLGGAIALGPGTLGPGALGPGALGRTAGNPGNALDLISFLMQHYGHSTDVVTLRAYLGKSDWLD